MNKNILHTGLVAFLLAASFVCFAQGNFVKLKGNKFVDGNGNDFYPIVCNYMMDFVKSSTGYFIIPHGKYGSTWLFDCSNITACQQQIQTDFHEMKLMGFNTIRVVNVSPTKRYIDCPSVQNIKNHFFIKAIDYPNDVCSNYVFFDINAPYNINTNTNLQIYFGQIDLVLNAAQAEALKIILVTGGGEYLVNNDVPPSASYSGQTNADKQAADYAALLLAFADYFKNNTTLMAYDLYNEPQYSDSKYNHSKSEICSWVTSWYDALKTNDLNHPVTMALNNWTDVFEWDPAGMKLDFLSEHIYPDEKIYENYNINLAQERYHNELVWLKNNLPYPWIIGETGFVASNNSNAPNHVPPWVMGNENDQANFAQFSLDETRGAGSSGWAWWQFQDVFWFGNANPNTYRENWFGLLRYADPISGSYNTADEKPAVSVIQSYNPNIIPSFAGPTANYFDPGNHSTLSLNTNIITGQVLDQNLGGNAIQDAVLYAFTLLYQDIVPPFTRYYDVHYTFTNNNGSFSLIPYDYDPRSPNYPMPGANTIEDYRVSSLGTERKERGWAGGQVTNGETIYLKRSPNYNASFNNITVTSGNTQNFQGFNSTTTTNLTIQPLATSDITARNEIHVLPNFHAQSGSEVHIYTSLIFPDCSDFNGFSFYRELNSSPLASGAQTEKSENIEIDFAIPKNQFAFSIYPIPNKGKFTVAIISSEKTDSSYDLKIFDVLGNKVYSGKISTISSDIDLSFLNKGLYYIQVKFVTQKLIIQ